MDISTEKLKTCLESLKKGDLSKKLVKDYTFFTLTRKIINKNYIKFFHKNLNILLELINYNKVINKVQTRIFITTFIIYTYQEIVLNNT